MSTTTPATPTTPDPTWLQAAAPSEAADAAVALFASHWGGQASGVWAAPGRVNLIGEHLDYNGGPVLPLALPHSTVAAVRTRADGVVRLVSAADLGGDPSVWEGHLADVGPGAPQGWAAYVAGVVWALREAGHDVGGLDAAFVSTVPVGAGLSSSAALECAAAVAVADLAELGDTSSDAFRAELAEACVRAENEVARASTGGMDQAASLRSTAAHALLLDTSDASVQQVPLPLAEHGRALLVMDTRAPHSHSGGEYGSRRAASERAAQLLGLPLLAQAAGRAAEDGADGAGTDAVLERLRAAASAAGETAERTEELVRRTRHVITETARVHQVVSLLRAAAEGSCLGVSGVGAVACLDDVGPVLSASHASMRDDYEISCAELDVVCAAAEAAGALGARMTGGGFGGSAVALVRAGTEEAVAAAVRAAALEAGHPEPAFLRALASPGASRLR